MRTTILIFILHITITLVGQEKNITRLSEKDFDQISNDELKGSNFLKYHHYSSPQGKYLLIDNKKIDLVAGEYLIKSDRDLILTEVTNESYSGPSIYKRTETQRDKIIDLPIEGSILSTNPGFLYLDFSHGQGCNYQFYSNEGNLLSTYKPFTCFEFSIERITKDFIVIAAQESMSSNEIKLAILDHSGELVKETTFETVRFGVPNMHYSDGMIYMLLRGKHPTQKLKVFDDQLNSLYEVNLGSVIRHQLSFQNGTIAYLTRNEIIVRNANTGEILWKKEISGGRSYGIGSSRNKSAISILLKGTNGKKELVEFELVSGNELSRSEININQRYQRFFKIHDTPNGCLIYNGKEIINLRTSNNENK